MSHKKDTKLLWVNCVEAVCVLCLFLKMPWVGLQSEIVAFPDHTHLLSYRVIHFEANLGLIDNSFGFPK